VPAVHPARRLGLGRTTRDDLLRAAGDEDIARMLEQVRVDRALAAGIVEQDERFAGRPSARSSF
jgi:hypothetical protein